MQLIYDDLRGALDCYDVAPAEHYPRRITCPVFAFFGANDPLCPARLDFSIYAKALNAAGNRDFLLQMMPHGHCPPMAQHMPIVVPWIQLRFGPGRAP